MSSVFPEAANLSFIAIDGQATRITSMTDGRTHLAHKAEHALDMETAVYNSNGHRARIPEC